MLQGNPVVGRITDQPLNVTGNQGEHLVGLATVLWVGGRLVAKAVYGQNMGVVAQASYGPCLPGESFPGGLVEPFGPDNRQVHVAVQDTVVGQVDPLSPPSPRKLLTW